MVENKCILCEAIVGPDAYVYQKVFLCRHCWEMAGGGEPKELIDAALACQYDIEATGPAELPEGCPVDAFDEWKDR